jgi:hypothetical protein
VLVGVVNPGNGGHYLFGVGRVANKPATAWVSSSAPSKKPFLPHGTVTKKKPRFVGRAFHWLTKWLLGVHQR